jgi:hypothetical protein
MWGSTARVIRTRSEEVRVKINWACSIELSSGAAGGTPKPALFTNRSIRPFRRKKFPDSGID